MLLRYIIIVYAKRYYISTMIIRIATINTDYDEHMFKKCIQRLYLLSIEINQTASTDSD